MARKFLTGIDVTGQKITNVADGTAPTDGVNRGQLDNAIAGLAWKQPVRVATTVNGTLATAYANGSVVDGQTLATGDRILLKDQTAGAENGIYTVNASGAPTRSSDANIDAELNSATVYVRQGTANADKAFTQTADNVTLGTTALVWAQVGGGTVYTAGNGLSLSGSQFAVTPKAGGGLIVDGTGVSIDTTYTGLAKRYAIDVPSGSTTATITHNLGTVDLIGVLVKEVSTNAVVECDITITGVNTISLTFGVAPTTGQYRVSIGA